MYLTPAPGRMVQDPERGDQLPALGREVSDNQYWQRRLIDGDVVRGQAPAETARKAKE